ncbi:pyridoxamine 5'-phosphate oxidase family protein [Nocardioides sp. zg-579]|uniref:Pyridoxamine 5'-phosphate oxidase family protein n=1 Tax=Nocardioides marmotae TaxID=2663857 RepID=A0A6I3JGL7_9ACTN|nr:pyridoxamine 5'-phosphate oxidase family protein [Nocardioides marmotae]MCR6033610.1 pyridoxamine 5'-phosphate oxidase family protein [Gordonia jinghuaiqii]MTB97269.1 pyridoxamine 5'-phosphate oxidase family protein [Nocardioides marmotae]QKE01827.1 pyridoxamine 5'-phosphate oxidase family protein [Nocardioides marmotae]
MSTPARAELHTLSPAECWALLASREIGRVAWSGPAGPTVLPVNYGIAEDAVWIRTSAYAALVREADESPVAFEVDDVDPAAHAAWSVLVRGTAHVRFPDDRGPTPPEVETWPAGPRPLWVVVVPSEITGRRLPPVED